MLSCVIGVKSINSFDYDEAKLREWSNKEILRCPECGERVIYCKGDYKIPYFKHEVASECVGNVYYEPMTDEHINGIKELYERLKCIEGVENLEVEKYIKNTKQRPDIYFEYKGERYCIEYQCSPISTQYNKRHELYALEGIKDIWILGTEKYGFEKFKINNDFIEFNEKKIKAIEDEIDRGTSPLLYFDSSENYLYKVDVRGFKCITRWKGSYEVFKNNVLKTKVRLKLDRIILNNADMSSFTLKNNKPIEFILNETSSSIACIEKILKDIKDNFGINANFKYDLDNDRFPIYKVDLIGNSEFYNGSGEIEDFINNCYKYYNSVTPILKDISNDEYKCYFNNGFIIIKNIKEDINIFNQSIATIIRSYSYSERKYTYNFDTEELIHITKDAITIDKRRVTREANMLKRASNLEYNVKMINSVIDSIDNKDINIHASFSEKSIRFSYGYISQHITIDDSSELTFEHFKKIIDDKICDIVAKNNEYIVKNAYIVYIDNDDRFPKTISEVAKDYGLSGRKLNEILCELKIQSPTLKGGYKSIHGITRPKKISHNKWTTYIIWDKPGSKVIYKALKKEGILPNIEKCYKED